MRRNLKRFVKILFCSLASVAISFSFVRLLLYMTENTFSHLEREVIHYHVRGNEFQIWNFTSKLKINSFVKHNQNDTYWMFLRFREYIKNIAFGVSVEEQKELCDGMFVGHAHWFAVLTNVIIDPSKGQGRAGGENIIDVTYQPEESEYYNLSKGYFKLKCHNNSTGEPFYAFSAADHLRHWISALQFQSRYEDMAKKRFQRVTICIQRYEYANLYHTMTDFYNVFVMLLIFNLDPDRINILWIDGHPKGGLDRTWKTLFRHVIRAGNIKQQIIIRSMIWSIMGYNSLINHHSLPSVPFLEDFRHFFLNRHEVKSFRNLNCSSVTISFIWRRDYVAHPRNPDGHVQRKIENEDELIISLRSLFPNHKIYGFQLDSFPMQQQLQHVTESDILIGMHGAGLTHALFLQQHAALVELFPSLHSYADHFKAIARWRGLKYARWNKNTNRNPKEFTYVNSVVINSVVTELLNLMCSNMQKKSV